MWSPEEAARKERVIPLLFLGLWSFWYLLSENKGRRITSCDAMLPSRILHIFLLME